MLTPAHAVSGGTQRDVQEGVSSGAKASKVMLKSRCGAGAGAARSCV